MKKIACYIGKVKDMPRFSLLTEDDNKVHYYVMDRNDMPIDDIIMAWACGFISADEYIQKCHDCGYSTEQALSELISFDRSVCKEQLGK